MSEEHMTGTERTPAQPPLSDFFENSDGARRAPEAADTADTYGEFDDDEFGAAPAPQRRLPLVTGLLVLGVALALTFAAGVLVQKHHDAGTTAATPGAGAFPGGGFPGGAGAGFPNGSASTGASASGGSTATTSGPVVIGTVVSVKGKTMTVKDLGGKQHVVHLTASTTATKTITITVGALTPGTTVSVEGTTNADGSVGATAITTR
jgi:hypothetical protein